MNRPTSPTSKAERRDLAAQSRAEGSSVNVILVGLIHDDSRRQRRRHRSDRQVGLSGLLSVENISHDSATDEIEGLIALARIPSLGASAAGGTLVRMAKGLPYTQFDLKSCKRGDIWRVELSRAANVFMVDSSGFSAFKSGRNLTHYGGGGLITRSPHDFVIPRAGHWYIVGHTWGLRDSSQISVTPVTPVQAMDPATPFNVDLASIARDAAQYSGDPDAPPVSPAIKKYDVFVSHATEDKEAIVRPLATALKAEGLEVWYDEFELRIGSSLRRSIDTGLANSRFGVVVLSEPFFRKGWANYELDGLVTREMSEGGRQLILPLWHRVTKDEVIRYSPSLADKLALRTADYTIEEIASEIAGVIREKVQEESQAA